MLAKKSKAATSKYGGLEIISNQLILPLRKMLINVVFSVYCQGDIGTNWYSVLSGSLDFNVSDTGDPKVSLG